MVEKRHQHIENYRVQMRKGILELVVLLVISRGDVYSSEILKILKKLDLLVIEGTLYPLMSRLHQQGLLGYRWEESETGPPRKYYSLTEQGTETLAELKSIWSKFNHTISKLTKKYEKSS
jgi:PadR family transcriptional regulator, regulatory protein PadR